MSLQRANGGAGRATHEQERSNRGNNLCNVIL